MQVPYTVKVIDHYDTVTYTYQVIDHYEDQIETYKRLDHYETTYVDRQIPVYTTVTEEYQVETFQDVTMTGTRTVYDQVPIYEERTKTEYIASARVSQFDAAVPANGLIFVQGNVTSLKGTMVDRVTVASRGSVMLTGNIVYKDAEGDTAYKNGDKPWHPYEPNPDYSGRAILGIIAQQDILYSRLLPDNSELNASMMAITGRVGIEGIVLDDSGEVSAFNQLTDQWGRLLSTVFKKNSIRRLGGITTAKRPIETVVKDGKIVSGFNIGQSVFDIGLLEGPPPFFLAYPVPRFFATTIVK